jgi:hypothetical protein
VLELLVNVLLTGHTREREANACFGAADEMFWNEFMFHLQTTLRVLKLRLLHVHRRMVLQSETNPTQALNFLTSEGRCFQPAQQVD